MIREYFYHLRVRLTLLEDVNTTTSNDSKSTAKGCFNLHIPRPLIIFMINDNNKLGHNAPEDTTWIKQGTGFIKELVKAYGWTEFAEEDVCSVKSDI